MKKLLSIVALASLVACGGGGDGPSPVAAAACHGAIVTLNAAVTVPGVCTVVSTATTSAGLLADVDAARALAGAERAYVVAAGPGVAITLQAGALATGHIDGASLWLGTFDPTTDLHGSIVTWSLNGDCDALAAGLRARHTPATCSQATAFDGPTAVRQLGI